MIEDTNRRDKSFPSLRRIAFSLGIALILGTTLACGRAHKVYRVNDSNSARASGDAIAYSLPRNEITFDFVATRIEQKLTPLTEDEDVRKHIHVNYQHIFPKSLENSVSYRIEPKPVLATRAVPDPDQIFVVEFAGGPLHDRTLDMKLTSMGFMTTGQSADTNKTVDFVVETVKTVADVVSAGFAGLETDDVLTTDTETKIDNIMKDIGKLRTSLRFSLAEGAWRGSTVESFERQLKEFEKREEELLSNFRTIKVSKWIGSIVVDPGDTLASPINLLQISPDKGLKKANEAAVTWNSDIPSAFVNTSGSKTYKDVKLVLKKSPAAQLADTINDTDTRRRFLGFIPMGHRTMSFYYRIPVGVDASVQQDSAQLASKPLQIAQWGPIRALPRKFNSLSIDQKVTLDEKTGALTQATIATKAFNPQGISQVGAAASKAITAQRNAELNRLKRERDTINLKREIQKLNEEDAS